MNYCNWIFYASFITKTQKNRKEDIKGNDSHLFVSFDLVNSTKFKNLNPRWPEVILKFYEISVKKLANEIHSIKIWKFVGDEVLFYLPISELNDLNEILKKINNAQNYVINDLSGWGYHYVSLLSVKATAWFANVDSQNSRIALDSENNRNIVTEIGGSQDFIGVDIDIGFRISSHSSSSLVAVSDQLVYYLYRMRKEGIISEKIENHLKIVGFIELKGVWLGRHYPIIWYHQNWNEVKKKSPYDERFHSELLHNVLKGRYDIYHDDLSMIKNILIDVNLIDHYDSIYKSLLGKNK